MPEDITSLIFIAIVSILFGFYLDRNNKWTIDLNLEYGIKEENAT